MSRVNRAIQYGVVPTGTAKTISGLQLLTELWRVRYLRLPFKRPWIFVWWK